MYYMNPAVCTRVLSFQYILISLHKVATFSLDLSVWRSLSRTAKQDLPYGTLCPVLFSKRINCVL